MAYCDDPFSCPHRASLHDSIVTNRTAIGAHNVSIALLQEKAETSDRRADKAELRVKEVEQRLVPLEHLRSILIAYSALGAIMGGGVVAALIKVFAK